MISTAISKASVTISVKNIHLNFSSEIYKPWSLKSKIIDALSNPIETLLRPAHKVYALRNISFEAFEGDRIGLIGHNGAGKTTLCRLISNVYQPQQGQITTNGQVRGVFDTNVGIFPDLTGRENAELLLKYIYPELAATHHQMLADIVSFSGLSDSIDMPFRTYSNGMRARLCLSLISAHPSSILILDEVFDGADQEFQQKISYRIQDLVHKSKTVIFVSHSPEQILKICNRVLVMSAGEIVFDGNPIEGLAFYNQIIESKSK